MRSPALGRTATLVLASTSSVIALCTLVLLASMLFQLFLRARGEGTLYGPDGQWSLWFRISMATFLFGHGYVLLFLLHSLTGLALRLRRRHPPRWSTVPLVAGWIVLALYVVGAQGFWPAV